MMRISTTKIHGKRNEISGNKNWLISSYFCKIGKAGEAKQGLKEFQSWHVIFIFKSYPSTHPYTNFHDLFVKMIAYTMHPALEVKTSTTTLKPSFW